MQYDTNEMIRGLSQKLAKETEPLSVSLACSERGVGPRQVAAAMQGRLRDPEGDRARRLRGGLRRQAARHRPRLRPQGKIGLKKDCLAKSLAFGKTLQPG